MHCFSVCCDFSYAWLLSWASRGTTHFSDNVTAIMRLKTVLGTNKRTKVVPYGKKLYLCPLIFVVCN